MTMAVATSYGLEVPEARTREPEIERGVQKKVNPGGVQKGIFAHEIVTTYWTSRG